MSALEFVLLPKEIERSLFAACRDRLPHETCGVIYGQVSANQVTVDGFAVIRNNAAHPAESFSFSPDEWTQAYFEAQKNQRSIVGFFHSHPEGTPVPSAQDSQGWVPWGTYWIVALTRHDSRIAVYVSDPVHGWRALPLETAD